MSESAEVEKKTRLRIIHYASAEKQIQGHLPPPFHFQSAYHGQWEDENDDFDGNICPCTRNCYPRDIEAFCAKSTQAPNGGSWNTLKSRHEDDNKVGGNEKTHGREYSQAKGFEGEYPKIETENREFDKKDDRGPENLTKVGCFF